MIPHSTPSGRPGLLSLSVMLVLLLAGPAAHALVTFSLGNDPVQDGGWPGGSLDVANLESRVVTWEGPMFDAAARFAYRGDAAAFQAALDLFAKIDAPERVLVVHEGPASLPFLKDEKDPKSDGRYDWSFTVTNPKEHERLHKEASPWLRARLSRGGDDDDADPGVPPPPRLDVYVGGAPPGAGVDWSAVTVPEGVAVTDERASANGYPAGAGSVVRGRVTDLAGGKPIAGARVTVTTYNKETKAYDEVGAATADADGRFELTGLPPGEYSTLSASAKGYAPRSLGYATFGKDTFKQYPSVRLARAVTIGGTVTSADDGRPMKGVEVRADSVMAAAGKAYPLPSEPRATTDASGRFTLAGLPEGTCQLYASAEGVHQVDSQRLYAIPARGVAIKMAATGAIRVKVTQAGGAPTAGPMLATLTPEGGDRVGSYGGSAELKADGTFTFEHVPPGKYTVSVRLNPGPEVKGKDPHARDVEVKAGTTGEVVIEW
jgi:hypothetical protein